MKTGILLTFRILQKNKLFAAISIINLTLGISACLMLLNYVRYERSFDQFYPGIEQVYRISYEQHQNGNLNFHSTKTMSALAPTLKREFPEVKEAIRGLYEECLIYLPEEQKYLSNQKVFWADEGFLKVFQIPLLQGNPDLALKEPYTAIISEKKALALFGEEDPLGKSFTHNEGLVFKVTGVFEELPQNTHLQLDFIYSYITFADWPWGQPEGNWRGNWLYTYIRTQEDFDPLLFESKLETLAAVYMPDLEANNIQVNFHLQAVKDIHLHSNLDHEIQANGDSKTVILLILVSCMLMVITWINYINLLAVQINDRSREIAIRKSMGERPVNLYVQSSIVFLVFNLSAALLSIGLVAILTPLYHQVFDMAESTILYTNSAYWIGIGLLLLTGSMVAGIYPSLLSARVNSKNLVSDSKGMYHQKSSLRKILVVIQFALSAILICNVLVLSKQVNYMLDKDLGFNKENVLVVNAPETWCQTSDSLKSSYIKQFSRKMLEFPEISSISACRFAPGVEIARHIDNLRIRDSENARDNTSMLFSPIDNHYFKALDIPFVAGRSFKEDFILDRNCIIVNESALKALGIPDAETALQTVLANDQRELEIIAVVKDHHHQGIKSPIKPTVYVHRYRYDFGYLLIHTRGSSPKALQLLQDQWKTDFPETVFTYESFDDFFNKQYKSELRLRKSILFFTLLAMVLACIGLFGLVKFSLKQRVAEISIKRTLGASVSAIVLKLTAEFMRLIGISLLIAFGVSYFTASEWLQNFAYRCDLGVGVFLISALLVLTAGLLTVIWNVYIAATRNPALGLRNE